jgi:hypothetical protein
MVVKSAAKSVPSGLEEGEVSQKWAANGIISAVPVRTTYIRCTSADNFSQYRERRDGCMVLGVFEVKKEIPNEPDEQGNSDRGAKGDNP